MNAKSLIVPALIMAIFVTSVPLALANGNGELPPGYSPGYWKHQCQVIATERGNLQEDYDDMIDWIDELNFADATDAWNFFKGNNSDGHKTDLANEFNALAGYGPYVED